MSLTTEMANKAKEFFIDIGDLSYFAGRFFKEAISPPFEFKELLARIKALTKRSNQVFEQNNKLKIADLVLDLDKKIVNFMYEQLENHMGGWEINEGSYAKFTFDPHRNILIFEFAYNTEEQARELVSSEKF